MALPNPYQMYRQQQVYTTPQEKLFLMLYDGAIKFCRQAKLAIQKKEIEEAGKCLVKSQRIIEELMNSLNMDYDIAENLYSLYDYMYRRLVQANVKKDQDIIDEVTGFLTELRETWAEAAQKAKKESMV